jgi:DNA-binding winged helix-turn-helix (wHTH) protein/tetratricopeptide (TPR) repeat protein
MSLIQKEIFEFGPFLVDPADRTALRDGLPLAMTPKVFDTLVYLIRNRGRLLSKDELLKGIWPATFVEEVNLAVNISALRKLFGEGPQDGRYIVTVPGRGYRFVAAVSAPVSEQGPVPSYDPNPANLSPGVSIDHPDQTLSSAAPVSPTSVSNGNLRDKSIWIAAAAAAVILIVAGLSFKLRRPHPSPGLTAQDSILLTDFQNTTGESVLDDTLKEGMAVNLGQSPFLDLVANDRVRETLRFMGRSPDGPVPLPLAWEICQRAGAKALVSGAVSRLGTAYVVSLEAVNCVDGAAIAREQLEAKNKETILPALSQAAAKLRGQLGESLSSIQQFAVPIEQATTPSLEALKAYSIGAAQRARGAEKEAIPFFDHAIELDPNFAMAYARRGAVFNNLGETNRASEDFKRAYSLRSNLSEREKLYLTIRYQDAVAGDTSKSIETYEMWSRLYPRDLQPFDGLAARYQIVGEYEKAAAAAREALKLRPDNYVPYANLATSYEALNRFDEAKQICSQAAVAKRDSSYTHRVLFELAFLRRDAPSMQHEVELARGTDREHEMLVNQAFALAALGKLKQARQLFDRSWANYERDGLQDHAAYSMAQEALIEADFGNIPEARTRATEALRLGRGIDARETTAEVLSLAGEAGKARTLTQELRSRFPQHAPLNAASLPTILAAAELQRGNASKAIDLLREAEPYDMSEFSNLSPIYIRGQAYLRLHSSKEAAAEFQRLLDHTGINALSPRHALARLGLARALALEGDRPQARRAYEDFLAYWSEADPELPILRRARIELSKLN